MRQHQPFPSLLEPAPVAPIGPGVQKGALFRIVNIALDIRELRRRHIVRRRESREVVERGELERVRLGQCEVVESVPRKKRVDGRIQI